MTAAPDNVSIVRRFVAANSLGLVILIIGWGVAFVAGLNAAFDGFMGNPYDQDKHEMAILLFWVAALVTPVAAVTVAAQLKRRAAPQWASHKAWLSSLVVVIGDVAVLAASIAISFGLARQSMLAQFGGLLALTLPFAAQFAFASFAARQEIRRIGPLT